MRVTANRFDQIVCSTIPGNGRDNVRKNGDFTIVQRDEPWHQWTTEPSQLEGGSRPHHLQHDRKGVRACSQPRRHARLLTHAEYLF